MNDNVKPYKGHLNPYGWLMRISLILCGSSILIACLAPMQIGSLPIIPIIWPILLTGAITWTASLVCLVPSFIIRQILFVQYFKWLNQYLGQLIIAFVALIAATVITFLIWCLSTVIFPTSLSGIILGIGWTVPLTFLVLSFIVIQIAVRLDLFGYSYNRTSKLITSSVGNFRACIVHKTDHSTFACLTNAEFFTLKDLEEKIREQNIKRIYLYFGGNKENPNLGQFESTNEVFDDNSLFISVGYEESILSLLLGRPYHEKAIQGFQAAYSFASKLLKVNDKSINYQSKYWLHAGYNQLSSFTLKTNTNDKIQKLKELITELEKKHVKIYQRIRKRYSHASDPRLLVDKRQDIATDILTLKGFLTEIREESKPPDKQHSLTNQKKGNSSKKGILYTLFKLFFYDLGVHGSLQHEKDLKKVYFTNNSYDQVIPKEAMITGEILKNQFEHCALNTENLRNIKGHLKTDKPCLTFVAFSNGVAVVNEGSNHIDAKKTSALAL